VAGRREEVIGVAAQLGAGLPDGVACIFVDAVKVRAAVIIKALIQPVAFYDRIAGANATVAMGEIPGELYVAGSKIQREETVLGGLVDEVTVGKRVNGEDKRVSGTRERVIYWVGVLDR